MIATTTQKNVSITSSTNSIGIQRQIRLESALNDFEKEIWREAGLEEGMRVLHADCGCGLSVRALAEACSCESVTGQTGWSELADYAVAHNSGLDQEIQITGDALEQLEADGQQFDFIYSRFACQRTADATIQRVFDLLAPGGTFCAVDTDDDWFTMYPCEESYFAFSDWAAAQPTQDPVDRFVGRKVGNYCREAGFADVFTRVVPISTSDVGVREFVDIVTGFRCLGLTDQQLQEGHETLEAVYQVADAPRASGTAGLFVVTGRKPAN